MCLRRSLAAASLAETLLSALLQVPEASRGAALQAVLVAHPPSAASLARRFFDRNHALVTRAAMLDALIDAAHELARLPKSSAVPRDVLRARPYPLFAGGALTCPDLDTDSVMSDHDEAAAASPLRIVGKVRRWGTGRRAAPVASANGFEAAVVHFFFPLIGRVDAALAALADDPALLARLLYALGVFVLCAGPASAHVERTTDELLGLLWALRFHAAAQLRRALLISAWHAFSAAPAAALAAGAVRAEEWRAYLESVVRDDADDECRLVAAYDLSALHAKLSHHAAPLLPD